MNYNFNSMIAHKIFFKINFTNSKFRDVTEDKFYRSKNIFRCISNNIIYYSSALQYNVIHY